MDRLAWVRSVALAFALIACDGGGEDVDAGGGTDAGPASDGGGGVDTGPPAPSTTLRVTGMGAEEIANGGRYEQTSLDGIPPYSDGLADLVAFNITEAPLVIHEIRLVPLGEAEAFEWALNEPGNTSRAPLEVSEVTVPAGMGFAFGLFFQPLASGQRDVRVEIDHADGQVFSFTVVARGRDNATFSPVVSTAFERIVGRSNVANSNSAQPGGVVADAAGNVYLDLNVNGWDDRFSENLVMARVSADGSLGWIRELQQDHVQESRDIGGNQEIGGGQSSIAVGSEGAVYLVAERSLNTTASFQAFAMRVGADDGALAWATGITQGAESPATAADVLRGQSIDASLSDRVIVAGQVADSAGGFVAALAKADGALMWARGFQIGGVTRVGGLVVDADGAAYLSGIAGNVPFLARVDGVDGDAPTLAWSRRYDGAGIASVHGIALEGDGILGALDVRGAATAFLGARFAKSDGGVVWAQTWVANSGDNNNTLAVAVHDGAAVFAGRIAFQPFDTQGGEGFLLALDPSDGAYRWSSFHYGGKGAEELVTDHITGIVSSSAGLWVLHQQTPGANNMHHFWGRWYQGNDDTLELPGGDGSMRLEAFPLTAMADGGVSLTELTDAVAHPATTAATDWVDVAADAAYEEPVAAERAGFRAGTHGLLQRLAIDD